MNLIAIEIVSTGGDRHDMVHDARDIALAAQIEHEDHEFVASEARGHETLRIEGIEPFGEQPQQYVALMVAQRVVDMLEVVDVDDDQRGLGGLVLLSLQGTHDSFEIIAVRQPGQAVIARHVLDARLRLDALRHILEHQHRPFADGLVADTFDIALVGELKNVARTLAEKQVLHTQAHAVEIALRKQALLGAIAQKNIEFAAMKLRMFGDLQHRLGLVVDDRDTLMAVEHQKALRHVVERGIETPGHDRKPPPAHDRGEEKLAQAVRHLDIGQEIGDQKQADDDMKRRPGENKPGQNGNERAGRHENDGLGRSIIAPDDGNHGSQKDRQAGKFRKGIPQHID